MARIVLIPSLPSGMGLDIIAKLPRGFAVQVSDSELAALQARGVGTAELFADFNEWAAAVHGLTKEAALAAITGRQDTVIAALPSSQRGQFGVA
jgi:hypothetical protein